MHPKASPVGALPMCAKSIGAQWWEIEANAHAVSDSPRPFAASVSAEEQKTREDDERRVRFASAFIDKTPVRSFRVRVLIVSIVN